MLCLYRCSALRTEKKSRSSHTFAVCSYSFQGVFTVPSRKKRHSYLSQHFSVLKMVELKQMFEFSLHCSQSK